MEGAGKAAEQIRLLIDRIGLFWTVLLVLALALAPIAVTIIRGRQLHRAYQSSIVVLERQIRRLASENRRYRAALFEMRGVSKRKAKKLVGPTDDLPFPPTKK